MSEKQDDYPQSRAQTSNNWRVRDDTPRSDPPRRQQRQGSSQHERSRNNDQPNTNDDVSDQLDNRVYVGNLLYTVQREDIENLFVTNGFEVSGMSMSIDPFTGRNPSYAFVDLPSGDEANRAIGTLNGMELFGRPVKVNAGVKKTKRADRFENRVRNYQRDWGKSQERGLVDNYSPSFDRWNRDDAASHFVEPVEENRRLYVGDLPRIEPQAAVDVEMQQLFEGFTLAAVSKIINPMRDKPKMASIKGNHYYCFVDFETREEAERAAAKVNRTTGSWGGLVKVMKAKPTSNRLVIREQGNRIQQHSPS